MTRAEQLAELEKKAKALRERAAKVDAQKRRILRAEEKAQRAIDTRWKIIYGAAVMKAGLTGQLSQHISEKDRAWLAAHPLSQPKAKAAEPQKQSPAPAPVANPAPAPVANPAPAPVANPAPNLVQRMFKQP